MLAAAVPIAPKDPKSEAHNAPILDLTLLGTFKARVNQSTLRFATRKAKAVLAYVALGEVTGESRERLLGLLWSESDSVRARNSLRRAVKEVNDVLAAAGFSGFTSHKQTLVLDRSVVSIDVTDIQRAADLGIADPRLLESERIADTLLADIELVDPQFQAWVRAKRHALHDRLTHALERALPTEIGGGESVDLGQALLNLDPTHEVACRHVIRARIARNEIGGALKAYKTLWDELAEEYDTEPSGETQELIVKIKQQAGWSVRPDALEDRRDVAVVLPTPREPAAPLRHLFIAVAPFEVEGVDQSVRHVINGFRHEIIATLARFREWSVVVQQPPAAGTSSNGDREHQYTLTGTAYGGADGIRLVVTLEDPNGAIVLPLPITIRPDELLVSQQAIVRQIAMALNINVTADRLRRNSSNAEQSDGLYDIWLKGQSLILGLSQPGWIEAREIFADVIARAPNFSPAYSSLVQLRNTRHFVFPGRLRDFKDHEGALVLAKKCVQLDPLDSRAQLCVAWSYQLLGLPAQSTLYATLAADLNPTDPWTLMATAQIFAYCGYYSKAIEYCNVSLRLTANPLPAQRSYASAIHFISGKYEECIDYAVGGLEHSPAFAVWQCAALAHMNRASDARKVLTECERAVRANWFGPAAPSEHAIGRWMMQLFPLAVEGDWQRLRKGLALAGACVDLEVFGSW